VKGAIVQEAQREHVRVLEEDPVLLAAVPASSRKAARHGLQATRVSAGRGVWNMDEVIDPSALGILVLEGLLTRNIEIAGTSSSEILGPGDVLRPWDDDSELQPVPSETTWTVLEPVACAILDQRWRVLAGRWPDLGAEILHRVLRRSRWLAVLNAITNLRGIQGRVLLLLWHLAGNWGRVTPAGTLVPFGLTHGVIADLVGARRPSISTALTSLEHSGRLERVEEGWLLRGDPPSSGG
jgi:CRP-like cAMP-binding protein